MTYRRPFALIAAAGAVALLSTAALPAAADAPVPLIFDTDIGNDVDDALALGVIHALESRGECHLLAVTITKDHALCAPFVDAVNTFYGRGEIPIGKVRNGPTPDDSRFLELSQAKNDGRVRYPHDLSAEDEVEDATVLLRRVLSAQPDRSVVIAQVGFSTNLSRLLDSQPDEHSDLTGRELVKRKVKLLSAMAGAFEPIKGKKHREYNVVIDVPAARRVVDEWPTPIVFSGYEIGYAIRYPAASIEQDYRYIEHHPLPEAYQLYKPTPHERPCWDLTSVLYAVRPDRSYFGLSSAGTVAVEEDGGTQFAEKPSGLHRYLTADATQLAIVREALVQLASQPPTASDP